nr:hypothetical protein [Shigella sonnei]
MGYNVNVFIFVHIDADDDFQVPDWHVGQKKKYNWRTIGGKLKVTQLSTTGYLGQFDFCASIKFDIQILKIPRHHMMYFLLDRMLSDRKYLQVQQS